MGVIMKKTKNNVKKRKTIRAWGWMILATILLSVCFISIGNIILWKIDSDKSNKLKNDIDSYTKIDEVDDNENTELVGKPNEDDLLNDYWYYVKFPLINVDFRELKNKNNDTVAWINVNNTNINYPVVQTDNNDYYLTHSFDKTNNEAGWVFLDYRNDSSFSDKNTIVYAHSRLDKTTKHSLIQIGRAHV